MGARCPQATYDGFESMLAIKVQTSIAVLTMARRVKVTPNILLDRSNGGGPLIQHM